VLAFWATRGPTPTRRASRPLPLRQPGQKAAAGMHVFKSEQGVCHFAQNPVDNAANVFNFEQWVFSKPGESAAIERQASSNCTETSIWLTAHA
jgi:hypothetical protein